MFMVGDVKFLIKFLDGGWFDWGRNGVFLFFCLWGGRLIIIGFVFV